MLSAEGSDGGAFDGTGAVPLPSPFILMSGYHDPAQAHFQEILPNFTVIAGGSTADAAFVQQLRADGKIFSHHRHNDLNLTTAQLVARFREPFDSGLVPGGFDAIHIDEIHPHADGTANSIKQVEALRQLRQLYPNKRIFVWTRWQLAAGGPYGDILRAIRDYADMNMLEHYIREGNLQYGLFDDYARNMEAAAPGIMQKTIFGLYTSQGGFTGDDRADIGFYGVLDEQFHTIRNTPETAGTPGVAFWVYYRSEKETSEQVGRLANHYFFQNRTDYFGDGNSNQLVGNPQFDSNTSGWTLTPGTGGSITRTAYTTDGVQNYHDAHQQASHFTHGLKMVRGSSANRASYTVSVDPSMTYTVSAFVLASAGSNSAAELAVTRPDGTVIASQTVAQSEAVVGGEGPWRRIIFNFELPAGQTSIRIRLGDGSSSPGTALYWDFVELEEAFETPPGNGSIIGNLWHDADGDDTIDGGETRLAGWTVYLDSNGNGSLDAGEPSRTTGSQGGYTFADLDAGTYTVDVVVQPGWQMTFPSAGRHVVNLAAGQTLSRHFGHDVVLVPAALPYFEDFEDGVADGLEALAGRWLVDGSGRYEGTGLSGGDAFSLLAVTGPGLTSTYRMTATVQGRNGGQNRNSALIFDYQGPTDFKFAAAYYGADQWWIGHHDGAGWVADASVSESLDTDVDYAMELLFVGNEVSLRVDGLEKLSHTFADALHDGRVGPGTQGAVSTFDNVRVETAPVLPVLEDFADGDAGFFEAVSGVWQVDGLDRYVGQATGGGDAMSVLTLGEALPSAYDVGLLMRGTTGGASRNGLLIFDYQGPGDFKFTGGFMGTGQWQIGRFDGTDWLVDATFDEPLAVDQDYAMRLEVRGSVVTLQVDGTTKVSHDFGGSDLAGRMGTGTRNAEAIFDDLAITPLATLPYAEDFEDGRADHLRVLSGAAVVNEFNRYQVTPAVSEDGLALIALQDALPETFALGGIGRGKDGGAGYSRNAALIFDYQGPTDFKFAAGFMGSGEWWLGHHDGSDWVADVTAAQTLAIETDYAMRVFADGSQVTLLVDGEAKLSHTYGDPVSDGEVGLGTREAEAVFDDLFIDTAPLLPRIEDFEDGVADFFRSTSGWRINSGRYEATPAAGTDAFSIPLIGEPLPGSFDHSAVLNGSDGGAGYNRNAVLVFDYRSETDFKFAGAYFGTNEWRLGHHDGSGWVVDAVVSEPLSLGQDYAAHLAVRGGIVTLSVDGATKLSHDFGSPLSDGLAGLATQGAVAVFDDVAIREVADLPYSEDFSGGTAPHQVEVSGSWSINEFDRYLASPDLGTDGISLVGLAEPLPSAFSLGGIVRSRDGGAGFSKNAALIFDYQGPTDFKFAAGFVGVSEWWVGHHDGASWVADAQVSGTLALDTDFALTLFADGPDVRLLVDGVPILSHTFADDVHDGSVGVGTREAHATFDDLSVSAGPVVPHVEDFEDGIADFLFANAGWSVTSGRYEARPDAGVDAVSALALSQALPDRFDLGATVRGLTSAGQSRNGLLVFDYLGPSDFGYAGGFFGAGAWRIGRYDGTTWSVASSHSESLFTDVDYALSLAVRDGVATLSAGGVEKVTHDFGTSLSGGRVGLGTNDAVAEFDDLSLTEVTDDVGPRVVEVLAGGGSWTTGFTDALSASGAGSAHGYRVSTGLEQHRALPWTNVDAVSMRFDEAVTVSAGDLSVTHSSGSYGVTGVTYDPSTHTATWTLDASLSADHVQIMLADSVADAASNALDGEWVDGQSTVSGDGTAGGALSMTLHVQTGSSDQDDATSIYDVSVVRAALGASSGDGAYSPYADLNGDGTVTSDDFDGLLANQGRSLAAVAGGGAGAMSVTLEGSDQLVTTPSGTPSSGSMDIVLRTSDGNPVDLLDYSVRVGLAGASGVTLTGGGEATVSPAATGPNPPGLLNTGGFLDAPTYYLGTANFAGTVMPVADGSGLIRVNYEVASGALGTWTFEIVVGGPADTALVGADESTVALTVDAPQLTVTIPGDATGDLVVGADDLGAVLGNFTRNVTPGDLRSGDLTGDGVVGTEDLGLVLSTFTNVGVPSSATASAMQSQLSRWHGWKASRNAAGGDSKPNWLESADGV